LQQFIFFKMLCWLQETGERDGSICGQMIAGTGEVGISPHHSTKENPGTSIPGLINKQKT
jgi:hypothetical protein